MDQNDIYPEKDQPPFRRVYRIEGREGPVIQYLSMSCNHCADSPCLIACPTGAITRDPETRSILVDRDLCIGCHSCAMACPFGVPRYDAGNKMNKCDLCAVRVSCGLRPACVKVCPMEALRFGDPNDATGDKERAYARVISSASTTAR